MQSDPQQVRGIFLDAVENHTPHQWGAVLDRACGSDAELRHRVEVLLRAHEQTNSLLDAPDPAQDATTEAPSLDGPGTVIGPYKLLEQIGEGGFGVVFMAEQLRPVRRRVALKVIKPGMDSRQVIARFEAERQALALMDHPHIARVFDGGETATGRPYFVMELVRGVPVTDFCDQNHLPVRERLDLFLPICQAVHHAHQKGIIHRDLKPSNVLVTLNDGRPVVKVIDFGIAKATGQQLTEKTLFTNFAQMVGTPLYMSPEQAEMSSLDVDTRSDIYSLGVLLYELLTGTTPFDKERLRTAAYDEIRRIIREEEPPRPSTRISTLGPMSATVSANRKSDPQRLRRVIRGELDWVVMRCLEKDRGRRYETVNGLARDIERYLHDEPVTACPPAAAYRFRKFARRNKRAMLVGGLLAGLFLVLAVGLPVTFALRYQRDEALRDRERAERAEEKALAAENEIKIREHLARATALRRSGQPGQRFRALKEITEALKLNPETELRDELRTEAIACLLLPDLEVAREWQGRPIGSLAFAVDHAFERYARGDKVGNVSIRRLSDDEQLFSLPGVGQTSEYGGLEFSPDGRFFLQVSGPPPRLRARLWRLDGTEPRLIVDAIAMGKPAFSPDSQELAAPDPDGTIRIHHLASGKELRRIPSTFARNTEMGLAWNPRQPALAVWNRASVRLVDAMTGRALRAVPTLDGCSWVDWHPDGRLLAVSNSRIADYKIYVWDMETGRLSLPPLVGHKDVGIVMRFNHAGDRLLSTDWSGIWRLWDVRTGQLMLAQPALGACLQFSADDSLVAASTEHSPGPCRLFRFRSGSEYRTIARHDNRGARVEFQTYARLDAAGRLLAVRDSDGIALLDIPCGAIVGHLPLRGNSPLCFEPKNAALLTTGANGLLRWPIQFESGGETIRRFGRPELLRPGSTDDVWGSSADTEVISIPNYNAGAIVYHRCEKRTDRLAPQDDVRSCAVSPDGRWVATGSHGSQNGVGAKVWDAGEDPPRLIRELPVGALCKVGFSPDQKWLATTGGGMRLWTVGTWQEGPRLRESPGHLPAFTRDGQLLAMDDGPGVVRLVVPDTGKELARLTVPEQTLLAPIRFTPDGSLLVTVGRETGMVHVFDLRAIRRQLAELGLNWDAPPDPPSPRDKPPPPLQIEVVDISTPRRSVLADENYAQEVIALYRRQLEVNREDAGACNNLAWAYLVVPEPLRDVHEAVRLAKKAVARAPHNAMYQNTLGIAHYRDGQYQQAADVLKANLKASEAQYLAHDLYFLAMCCQKLGETARALDHFNLAERFARAHPNQDEDQREELAAFRAEAEKVLEIKGDR